MSSARFHISHLMTVDSTSLLSLDCVPVLAVNERQSGGFFSSSLIPAETLPTAAVFSTPFLCLRTAPLCLKRNPTFRLPTSATAGPTAPSASPIFLAQLPPLLPHWLATMAVANQLSCAYSQTCWHQAPAKLPAPPIVPTYPKTSGSQPPPHWQNSLALRKL